MRSVVTRLLEKFMPGNRQSYIRRVPRYERPWLEALEDRFLLTSWTYTGASPVDPTNWFDGRNWIDPLGNPGVPGSADDAYIPGGFAVVVTGGSAGVNSLLLDGSSTLGVGSSLAANTLSTNPGSIFNVAAGSPNPGQVTINQGGFFGGAVNDAGLITANSSSVDGTGVTFAGTTTIGPGDLNGNLNAGPNSSFTFAPSAGSTDTFVAGATLGPGDGSIIINGASTGTVAIAGNLLDNTMIIDLDSGILGGAGSIDEWATFNWTGISTLAVAGGVTVYNDFKANALSGGSLMLDTTLTNEETTELDGSDGPDGNSGIFLEPGGAIVNLAGIMTVSAPHFYYDAVSATGSITNSALGILDIAGSAPVQIATAFTNQGVLNVAGGSELDLIRNPLTFSPPPIDLSGKLFIDGTLGLYSLATTNTGLIVENDPGSFVIENGASLTIPAGVSLIQQGNLEVSVWGLLTGGGTVYNSGRLLLDPNGAPSSSGGGSSGGPRGHGTAGLGAYVQSNSGTLSIGIDPTSGAYTPLTVTGSAQLSGIVTLPGYVPAVGDSFVVVKAGSISGHFDSVPDGMVETDTDTSAVVTQVNPPAGS